VNFFFCPKPKNADMMHRCRAKRGPRTRRRRRGGLGLAFVQTAEDGPCPFVFVAWMGCNHEL